MLALAGGTRACLLARCTPFVRRSRSLVSGGGRLTLDTPFISDTIPLAEGVLGTVEELLAEVGQSVVENEVIAVVETDKGELAWPIPMPPSPPTVWTSHLQSRLM